MPHKTNIMQVELNIYGAKYQDVKKEGDKFIEMGYKPYTPSPVKDPDTKIGGWTFFLIKQI